MKYIAITYYYSSVDNSLLRFYSPNRDGVELISLKSNGSILNGVVLKEGILSGKTIYKAQVPKKKADK